MLFTSMFCINWFLSCLLACPCHKAGSKIRKKESFIPTLQDFLSRSRSNVFYNFQKMALIWWKVWMCWLNASWLVDSNALNLSHKFRNPITSRFHEFHHNIIWLCAFCSKSPIFWTFGLKSVCKNYNEWLHHFQKLIGPLRSAVLFDTWC
jgi:hypothetical protein